jgi:hypothetical protein
MSASFYNSGWNDVVYGISTCRTPLALLQYIYNLKQAEAQIKPLHGYAQGAIAALDTALTTGTIPDRKP